MSFLCIELVLKLSQLNLTELKHLPDCAVDGYGCQVTEDICDTEDDNGARTVESDDGERSVCVDLARGIIATIPLTDPPLRRRWSQQRPIVKRTITRSVRVCTHSDA